MASSRHKSPSKKGIFFYIHNLTDKAQSITSSGNTPLQILTYVLTQKKALRTVRLKIPLYLCPSIFNY